MKAMRKGERLYHDNELLYRARLFNEIFKRCMHCSSLHQEQAIPQ